MVKAADHDAAATEGERPGDVGTLVNPTSAGIVYDTDGRNLGGGERVEVTGLDDVGRAAVDNGHLLYTPGASQPE